MPACPAYRRQAQAGIAEFKKCIALRADVAVCHKLNLYYI
jgi:hypothetical protein